MGCFQMPQICYNSIYNEELVQDLIKKRSELWPKI